MANIIDYLEWRGDLKTIIDPLNEVDAALLARLTYQRFEMLEGSVKNLRLEDALERILELDDIENKTLMKSDYDFMKALVKSSRFKDFVILDYTDRIEKESQTQFSALTLLDNDTGVLFVFFRGTDNTLVGWKEDFNMAFVIPLPGQIMAKEYLLSMSALTKGDIIVGGHSKGGNLALYASAFVDEDTQKRIRQVYNFDGPGFDEETVKDEGFKRIEKSISTYVPQSSVVGMLLEHEEEYMVVHSTRSGLWQHDIYSWEVKRKEFEILDEVDNSSRFVDYTLKAWLKNMSKKEREGFVDALFSIMKGGNYSTLKELRENWPISGVGMLKGAINLTPEEKKRISEGITLLLKSSQIGLLNFLKSSHSQDPFYLEPRSISLLFHHLCT